MKNDKIVFSRGGNGNHDQGNGNHTGDGSAGSGGPSASYFIHQFERLDAKYVQNPGGDAETNEAFVDLGAKYIEYLENGGTAITDYLAKDSGDGTREQTLHDNLLGNVKQSVLISRGLDDYAADQGYDFGAFSDRPYHGGYDNENQTTELRSVAFDFEQELSNGGNVIRNDYDDYEFTTYRTELDDRATNGDEMWSGDGKPVDNFAVTEDEAAGIQLGLKAEGYRTTYSDAGGENGIYTVDAGVSPHNANRADWSFNMSAISGENGSGLDFMQDMDVQIWFDMDSGAGVDMVHIGNLEDIPDSDTGQPGVYDNSWNIGFDFLKSQIDDGDYNYEEGEFRIELRAVFEDSGDEIATVGIDVLVENGSII